MSMVATTSPPSPANAGGSVTGAAPPGVVKPQSYSDVKEWVAALLSFAIVGFTLYFLYTMFGTPEVKNEQWERQSAMLQIAVSFAGAVIGYYFGRLPAEKAAAAAQQSANQASVKEGRIRAQVAEVRRQVSTTTPTGGGAAETTEAYRARVISLLNTLVD